MTVYVSCQERGKSEPHERDGRYLFDADFHSRITYKIQDEPGKVDKLPEVVVCPSRFVL